MTSWAELPVSWCECWCESHSWENEGVARLPPTVSTPLSGLLEAPSMGQRGPCMLEKSVVAVIACWSVPFPTAFRPDKSRPSAPKNAATAFGISNLNLHPPTSTISLHDPAAAIAHHDHQRSPNPSTDYSHASLRQRQPEASCTRLSTVPRIKVSSRPGQG